MLGALRSFPKAFASISRNGRLVTAGAHAGGIVPLDLNRLYLNYVTIVGSTAQTDADVERSWTSPRKAILAGCVAEVDTGRLELAQATSRHDG